MRRVRAWLYRRLPFGAGAFHLKRRAGYERRWNLEGEGFTQLGFFRILDQRILRGIQPGVFFELVAGDGLVGSLGVWLEEINGGWQVHAWEHRAWPALAFQKNRPLTVFHPNRLTSWSEQGISLPHDPAGITTRGAREAAGVCRAIRQGRIRPSVLGIWNPRRHRVWEARLRSCGYRLQLIHDRMEFYLGKGK